MADNSRVFGNFLREQPGRRPTDNCMIGLNEETRAKITDAEYAAIGVAQNLEIGTSAHLLLRELGYDAPAAQPQMGVLNKKYNLADAYEKITVAGNPMVDSPEEAAQIADSFFISVSRHAKLTAQRLTSQTRTPS